MDADGGIDEDRLHFVLPAADLAEGDRAIVEARGRDVAVFRVNDEFYAVGDHCPHMGGPCAEGRLTGLFAADESGELAYSRDNEILCCAWHGWEFDVTTGEHLGGTKKRLLTYDTTVRNGDLYVVV